MNIELMSDFLDSREDLATYSAKLEKYPHDEALRRRCGYDCTVIARIAVEKCYRAKLNVSDVAPRLEQFQIDDPEQKKIAAAFSLAKETVHSLLQQVLSDEISRDPRDPLAKLTDAYWETWTSQEVSGSKWFDIAVAAVEGSVGLLGIHEFGGVFSAWQLSTLAYELVDWTDQVAFNKTILADANRIYEPSAALAATEFDLPSLDYLKAGCIGNMAKFGLREYSESFAMNTEAGKIAQSHMDELKRLPREITNDLEFDTMLLMEEACFDIGDAFCKTLSKSDLNRILQRIREIEPCTELVQAVERHVHKEGYGDV